MRPDVEPRATDYIPQMVNIIDSLINKGYAYKADNGDVYYSVKKFKDYGKLSGKLLEDLNIGERVDIELHKQNPMDFVLWKAAKNNEPYWGSSLGNGRPGWHIECSAMSEEILGKNFDIHGGGQDLQFPHHENEIAQSEAHNGCKFANYWIHNGFLNINDEKMSKSLGNFLTLREVLSDHNPEVIKLLMLKTHYRSPLNFNYSLLEDAKQNLTKLYLSIKTFSIDIEHYKINWENEFAAKFKNAMNDDFNTPLAIGILFELTNSINISKNEELAKLLISLANIIGILNYQPLKFLQEGSDLSNLEIEKYISIRDNAKNNKNYKLADEIRNKLQNQGILLEDNVNGTSWRKI
jgi:cysteinyl-tRNA synthetase